MAIEENLTNAAAAHEKAREQLMAAENAYDFLRRALTCSKAADNKRTAERIRLAISSAKGAMRVCEGRQVRAQRAHMLAELAVARASRRP